MTRQAVNLLVSGMFCEWRRLLLQNYSPAGMNLCNHKKFAGDELLYTTKSSETLGPLYTKAHYAQYTSGTFKTKPDHPSWLGLLGPFIQTQVQLPQHHSHHLAHAETRSALVLSEQSAKLAHGRQDCHDLILAYPDTFQGFIHDSNGNETNSGLIYSARLAAWVCA